MQPTSNLTAEQSAQLTTWRAMSLSAMPYMATVLFSLRVVSAPGLETCGVDQYHRLYVDFDAMAPKGARYCAEVILHECCHLLGSHAARAESFGVDDDERQAWNVATDLEINDDLCEAGCSEIAADCLLPGRFGLPEGQTAERYMIELSDKLPKSNDASGCGSGAGAASLPCEAPGNEAHGQVAAGASDAEVERVRIATAANIRDAAGKQPGSVPGGLVELADEVLAPPKVPWRQVLAAYVRRYASVRAGDTDTTYLRRRRRQASICLADGAKVICPGSVSPKLSLAVVRDTSASMSERELADVMSEIDGIARQLGVSGEDLVVLDTDTEVAAKRGYRGAASLAEVHGRGGTAMGAGINTAVAMRPRPLAVVVLTDGDTPWPPVKPPVPVVVCLVGAGAQHYVDAVPKWAATVLAT